MPRDVRIVDSITQPDGASGAAVVAGSHGGISSGRDAAQIGVGAVVSNDAGVGRDEAGIESLPYLDELGCPAATVDHRSARIADGVGVARNGTVSHVNDLAAGIGVRPDDATRDSAERVRAEG